MHQQGAHATLAAALPAAAAAARGDGVAPCCLGLLLRFLRRLPQPAFGFAAYDTALGAGAAQLPALLRGLPAPHARLLQAPPTAAVYPPPHAPLGCGNAQQLHALPPGAVYLLGLYTSWGCIPPGAVYLLGRLQAVGEIFAVLLRHCAVDAAAPTASQQAWRMHMQP